MTDALSYESYEMEQAKDALNLARAYYAGVTLAARHRPDDPSVHGRLQEAVQIGRGAWQAYRRVAGWSDQPEAGVPSIFREE